MQRTSLVIALAALALLASSPAASAAADEDGCPGAFMLWPDLADDGSVDRNGDGLICVRLTEGGPIMLDNVLTATQN